MGSSSPKVKVPGATIAQAKRGKRRITEYYEDGYKALEGKAIADSHKDKSDYLTARAVVDNRIAQAQVPVNFRDIGGSAAGNTLDMTRSRVMARQQGQDIMDRKQLAVGNSGLGAAKQTAHLLGNASRMQAENAFNTTQNKITVSNARFGAGMDVLGGAAKGYAMEDQFQKDWDTYGGGGTPTWKDKYNYIMNGPSYLRDSARTEDEVGG